MPTRQEKCVFTTVVITMIVLAKLVLTKIVLSMIVYTLILLVLLSGGSRVCTAQATPPVGAVQPANGHSITGEWQGMVATQHLIVNIEQAADGTFTGKLTAVDQGNVTIPIDVVSFTPGGTLHLELKSIGAAYEAKVSDDGSQLMGTWQQGGQSVPLSLHRPGASADKLTLKPRTLGRIPLEPCRTVDSNTEGLCGKYEVYENRVLRSGRKIALNIMVLPAVSDKPASDPWFALAGGPGQSAVEAYPLAGFTTKVRQQHDVVLVDQRGTGGSNPLPCELRDPRDAQEVIGETMAPEKVRACRAALEKKADIAQYKIPVAFARTTQNSIDQLIERCAADDVCHKDFPDLKKEFQAIVERLEKSPAHFEVKNRQAGETQAVTLSRGMFVGDLRPLLYIPELVSQFPYMIHRAYQDDWSIFGAAVLTVRSSIDKSLDRGMSLSVICAEDIPGLTEATIRRETKGTYLGDFQVRVYQNAC